MYIIYVFILRKEEIELCSTGGDIVAYLWWTRINYFIHYPINILEACEISHSNVEELHEETYRRN